MRVHPFDVDFMAREWQNRLSFVCLYSKGNGSMSGELSVAVQQDNSLSKGLEGIIAAESSICVIDSDHSRLFFRGYSIHDLVKNSTFEEVAYLLLNGELPTETQLSSFLTQLAREREIPADLIKILGSFPKDSNPMAALRSGISLLAQYDPEADDKSRESNIRKVIRLVSKTPTVIATIERARKGQARVAPKADAKLGTAANFLYMLKGVEAPAAEARTLDQYFILLAEHDLNASTFSGMITVSTLSDLYSGVVSAIGTLKGDLHGGANSRAMESLIEVGDLRNVESYVDNALANKKKLMGFGHRVYKNADPRADDLRQMAKELAKTNAEQAKWFAISQKMEAYVWEKKKLYPNVDFYSASILYTMGIPVDLFTPMFAVSRMTGWTAHLLEQFADNRLIRPLSSYIGHAERAYVPIKNRP